MDQEMLKKSKSELDGWGINAAEKKSEKEEDKH